MHYNELRRPDPEDANVLIEFFIEDVENAFKSEKAGKPVVEKKEFIKIVIPGTRNEFIGEVTQSHIKRFPMEYERFASKGENVKVEGTPLSEVLAISASERLLMERAGFSIVEQVANANDSALDKVGHGARTIQKKCKAYLLAANDQHEQAKKYKELEAKVEELTKALAAEKTLKAEKKNNKVE